MCGYIILALIDWFEYLNFVKSSSLLNPYLYPQAICVWGRVHNYLDLLCFTFMPTYLKSC